MLGMIFQTRSRDDRKEEAAELLKVCFERQQAGTFSLAYFEEVVPRFYTIVKPEAEDELRKAMEHFAAGFSK